ncbi:MAG TPA: tRNA (adenosine(37)-N6)-threonylcarbamoyltransferase complex transferase subunit TsaD [Candidatus Acidoferrales bacterium]|jgi:N6-L-threonylcarbamoyladenine synthase|nr:tRNA (adenosine(37)-N6)-threonylcarbamoyltransferase complex transferase subunit TsaD [Candidatus Acidoferrales bacterium]
MGAKVTAKTRILGIESSCDETAAAVVVNGRRILSSVVASQIDIHRKYGGVVPELASREHLRQIVPVVREAMEQSGLSFAELDAIGVTQGPGLVGSLLVGITYGKTLAAALGKPLIAVNHLEGHIHAAFLEAHQHGDMPKLPAVCLIVSGGHTVLYEVKAADGSHTESFGYRRLGQTRDDAAGEAYDKVAKLLGLGYPGGPILDRLAAAANHAPAPTKFGPTKTRGNPLDFSFSGLKTSVLYHVREHPEYNDEIRKREEAQHNGHRTFQELLALCSPATLGLVREFQNAVVRDLVERTMMAAEECNVETILVSGGVAANSQLRATFEERAASRGLKIYFPSRALSTDNAAMIAAAAYSRFERRLFADNSLNATASMPLA